MSDTAEQTSASEPQPYEADVADVGSKGKDVRPKSAVVAGNQKSTEEQLNHLKIENARLHGKIRGYETLNTLFQEEKLRGIALKKEKLALEEKIKETMATETNKSGTITENSDQSSQIKLTKNDEVQDVNNSLSSQDSSPVVIGAGKAVDGSKVVSMGMQESGLEGWNMSISRNLHLSEKVTQDSDVVKDEDFIKFNNSTHREYFMPPAISSQLQSSDLYGPGSMEQGLSFGLHYTQNVNSLSDLVTGNSHERASVPVSHPGIGHEDSGSRGGSPNSIHIVEDLTNMIEKTKRLETSERAWRAFSEILQADKQEMKLKLKLEREEKANIISVLKRENLMLLQKIKKLEHERDALSPADSVTSETAVMGADWVHVTKQKSSSPVTPETPDDPRVVTLGRKVQFLEIKNKELSQANKDWESYRRISESTQEEKMLELRQKLAESDKALTDYQVKEEKRQRDIDKILLASKKRCQELEDENEELKFDLEQCQDKIKALEEQVQISQQQQQNELSQPRGAAQAAVEVPLPKDPHFEEIVNEKEALRQQLTIFQEDFDKERADRAKAQADKDTLQRQISEITKHLKKAQNHQKAADETLQSTLTETERLQQQVATLRGRLRSSEGSLQKCQQENDHLKHQLHEKMKQIRQQGVMTPTQGGQPYYPPSPGQQMQQMQNWQGAPRIYQSPRVENAPELLPGSWQCHACTYVNFPGRTVCEVCGAVNQQRPGAPHQNVMIGPNPSINPYWPAVYGNQGVNQPEQDPNNTNRQLIPRGRFSSNDLTTDSGNLIDG